MGLLLLLRDVASKAFLRMLAMAVDGAETATAVLTRGRKAWMQLHMLLSPMMRELL